MRIICITVAGEYQRSHSTGRHTAEDEAEHFRALGVPAQFFFGIHASKLGITTTVPYEVDIPGSGYIMEPSGTGCWLSHRALWAALLLLPDEQFLIVEDDAKFPADWEAQFETTLRNTPGDWDMIYVGSCCAADKPREHVVGNVWEVRWPFCTHGYFVTRSALKKLIDTQDEARCYAPIDISLTLHSLPHLKVYTVLPRILDQFVMNLHE